MNQLAEERILAISKRYLKSKIFIWFGFRYLALSHIDSLCGYFTCINLMEYIREHHSYFVVRKKLLCKNKIILTIAAAAAVAVIFDYLALTYRNERLFYTLRVCLFAYAPTKKSPRLFCTTLQTRSYEQQNNNNNKNYILF